MTGTSCITLSFDNSHEQGEIAVNYYALYQLYKEPFANSPDPDLFFYSVQQHDCLQKLELALRLRRGLSVVVGDIGTGKSTMCRTLVRQLDNDSDAISAHIFLDPAFTSPSEFLAAVITTFSIKGEYTSDWQMKEAIKNYLLQQGIEHKKIPVLIIDEGQKLPGFCIELLRELLNFETNRNKLLEIVIFAQKEFIKTLKGKPNFSDRITTYHKLGPLSFKETRQMIRYRIDQCREEGGDKRELFPFTSLLLIFLLSKGYPRKIVMLCSKILLAMVIKEKKRATLPLVWSCAKETSIPLLHWIPKPIYATSLLLLITAGVVLSGTSGRIVQKVQELLPLSVATEQQTDLTVTPVEAETVPPAVEALPEPVEISVAMAATTEKSQPIIEITTEPAVVLPPTPALHAGTPEPMTVAPPPAELGYLTVREGMSMSWMLSRVYGRYHPRDQNKVLRVNPYISDPGALILESKIFFPSLPDSPTSKLTPLLISFGRFTTLQAAYDFLINCPKVETPIRILPIWDGVSALSFHVVLEESFPEEGQARKALADLDSRLQPAAIILHELDGIPL